MTLMFITASVLTVAFLAAAALNLRGFRSDPRRLPAARVPFGRRADDRIF